MQIKILPNFALIKNEINEESQKIGCDGYSFYMTTVFDPFRVHLDLQVYNIQ